MRNQVSYPRVRAPRRAHRIAPALGGVVVSLLTGGLLFSLAETPARPAREAADLEPAGLDLRSSILSDIGPHAPARFAPRDARPGVPHLFVSRAAAEPRQFEGALRSAQAPEPPPRPAGLLAEGTAAPGATAPVVVSLDAPTPPRRPAELSAALKPEPPKEQPASLAREEPRAQMRQIARTGGATVVPAAPADGRGFFERLFGGAPQAAAPLAASRPNREVMAYAATPDSGGLFGGLRSAVAPVNPAARFDRYTAIYDISARTVYMPDGTRLEAHSGLREHLDDPRYVHLRMRGPTPPHLYSLTPREALFHGVEALRLNPLGGERAIFGRAGLLAHTYMLGPNGDSNGCVSFRDYNAFLQAYKRGEVRRLAVVAHL